MHTAHSLLPAAELIEFSEARAYASLAQPRTHRLAQAGSPIVQRLGSAVAIASPAVRGSLNLNRVIGLGVKERCDEAMLDAAAALYVREGLSYGIEVCPAAQPAELPQWLRERRLRRLFPTAMYWRTTEALAPAGTGLTVLPASTAHDVQAVAALCCAVFRMPAAAQALLEATWGDERWTAWRVMRDDHVIAAGMSFVEGDVAWLGWDATLAEQRGLGAHRELIAVRAEAARQRGCRYVTAETGVHTPTRADPSGRNYEKLGFLLAYERNTYAAMYRAPPAVDVRS